MMNTLMLAQAADASSALPPWASYIMGPLGALALLVIYALWTEKKRMPELKGVIDKISGQLKETQGQLEAQRKEHNTAAEALRVKAEKREQELEARLEDWRDRHTKERSVRAWYQAKAEEYAEDCGEKLKPPPDINKTSYGLD